MIFHSDKRMLNLLLPSRSVYVRHPKDTDFTSKDRRAHSRILRMTRGIYLMEEWWKRQNLHVTYEITSHNQYYLEGISDLEATVRQFHHTVAPHQKLSDKTIVFGVGATQLLHAAIYAYCLGLGFRNKDNKKFIKVPALYFTHQTPGYLDTKEMIESLNEFNAKWVDIEKTGDLDINNLVEIITCPNNPDSRLLKPITKASFHIHDRVNLWPFFMTASLKDYQRETLENDGISIFSLPKILSFSGARVGYAFVSDPKIAKYMKYFIMINTHGISGDGQIRCLTALRYLIDNNLALDYVNWVANEFAQRWSIIDDILPSTEMQLLNHDGAGIWVRTPSSSRQYLINKYKMTATYGPEYGASMDYARLNMQCTTNEFQELVYRLTQM